MMRFSLAFGILVLALTAAASGGRAADAKKGKTIAQRWCVACHVVAPDQIKGSVDAPTFAGISATRTVGQIKLALIASHTRMPDMALSRDEVDNLIVYIQSLSPPLDPFKEDPEKDTPPKQHSG